MHEREKVELFREKFRREFIPKGYSGPLHILFNASILFALSLYLFFQVRDVKAIELIAIPISLIAGNLTIFLIHRYPLHRRYKFIDKETYQVHTMSHHRFYTHEHYQAEKIEDLYALFFPPKVVVFFSCVFIPGLYFFLGMFLPHNLIFLTLGMSSTYFILYEVVHYTSHLPENHWVCRIGHFKKMRQHHLDHHNPKNMHQYNFNIVFPLFDDVFRTVYKKSSPDLK